MARGLSIVSIAKAYDGGRCCPTYRWMSRAARWSGCSGPNGAGKTTCFYSVMGLVKPDAGRILLDGEDITGLPMYRRAILGLGYLPQETSIFRGLTVAQNIMAVLEIAEPDKARARGAAGAAARRIPPRPSARRAGDGAVGRRAAALRDRPRAGGRTRRSCCSTSRSPASTRSRSPTSAISICQLKKRDIGVLITDHNVRETLDIVDRACIIYDGQVLFAGSPEALVADENVRRLYLGEGFEL